MAKESVEEYTTQRNVEGNKKRCCSKKEDENFNTIQRSEKSRKFQRDLYIKHKYYLRKERGF